MVNQILHQGRLKNNLWRIIAAIFVLAVAGNSAVSYAYTSELNNRSITISSSQPSITVTHDFKFDIRSAGTLGSIKLEYCTNPFFNDPCVAPAGLSLSGASLTSQTGATGFSIGSGSTANTIVLSRIPAATSAGTTVSYAFDNVTNPSVINQAVYVRISTYASNDASGPIIDSGSVVFELASGINIGGFVPPQLVICVGAVVALDCSNQTGDISDLGILSTTATRHATSEFSVATNDVNGYNVYISGTTLTSGNNTITAPTSPQISQIGTSQFGMNLLANSVPPVGSAPLGTGAGTVAAGYNQVNSYKFQNGDLIADSAVSTDFNLFTVSYIANINPSQPAGVYTTTLTYIAIVDF